MRVVKTELTHPNCSSILPNPRPANSTRYMATISGYAARARYCCFADTAVNAQTALMERVYYHQESGVFCAPHVPDSSDVKRVLSPFLSRFRSLVRTCPAVPLSEYPALSYTGRKRTLYERAVVRVQTRGERRSDAYLTTFLKHEKILDKPKRLVPRVIQPRRPEYNVLVGRYIRHLEKPIFGIINKLFGGPTVMKGMDAFAQGEAFSRSWMCYAHPVAIMLDASRFDQHVSIPLLQWEHAVYVLFQEAHNRADLARLLRQQLHNRGIIRCPDGIIKYSVDGCRCSGDMNTSMGNCLLMCAMVWSLAEHLGIKLRLHNNGDDCCVILDECDEKRFTVAVPEWFSTLGFVMVVEGRTAVLEEVSFCQTHPVFDGSSWRMVRDPRVSMSKDATILRRWSRKEYFAYLQCLGKGGLALASGLPLLQAYYLSMRKAYESQYSIAPSEALVGHVSGVLSQSGMFMMAKGLVPTEKRVTDAARASFARAFGILPEAQRKYEHYFSLFHPGDNVLSTLPPDPLPF